VVSRGDGWRPWSGVVWDADTFMMLDEIRSATVRRPHLVADGIPACHRCGGRQQGKGQLADGSLDKSDRRSQPWCLCPL